MFIYICGPYSPSATEKDPDKRKQIIRENVKKANQVAIELAKRGHIPFTPHTMMYGWEDTDKIPRDIILQICYKWLQKCDALFFIGPSPGANSELKQFKELKGKRAEEYIFEEIDKVPYEPLRGELVISAI